MPTQKPNIDLLRKSAGVATILGAEHEVKFIDGEGYRQINSIPPDTPEYTLAVYDIVERCIPTLGADVWKLDGQQAGALLGICLYGVKEVEEQFPNGSAPATSENAAGETASQTSQGSP
jgi:hypothetical protein